MASGNTNDILLHPDALRCLKRKQLESLCTRLGIKPSGKKDELVARLEGYAFGKVAQGSSPSRGNLVTAPARRRTSSTASTRADDDESRDGSDWDEEEDGSGLTRAGLSIRLISRCEEEEEGVGHVSNSSSRTVLGEVKCNEGAEDAANQASTSTKPIYPWKRISSKSIPKMARSASSNFTLSSLAAPSLEDDPMTLIEFGAGSGGKSASQKGSLSSLKRWLSKSSTSVAPNASKQQAGEQTEGRNSTPPSTPATTSSPASKRKRDDDEDEGGEREMAGSVQPTPEKPVRRVIKGRPSRAVKTGTTAPVSMPPPSCPSSPTAITRDDFSKAASKVLDEMNARLMQSGKASVAQLPSASHWSVSSSSKPPASPLKSMNSRTKGRFSNEHEKRFGQMDSISNHYAAKRERESGMSEPANAGGAKRIKITEEPRKRAEDRAAIQRKLDLSRQQRKSAGRGAMSGRKSGTKVGLKGKITGAVRGFVGAARGMGHGEGASASSPTRAPSLLPLPVATRPTNSSSRSRATFDLQASLARRPTGYKPYSAKETVEMLQRSASSIHSSPSKGGIGPAASPIRSGWTMIPAPTRPIPSSSSTIAFPTVSPRKASLPRPEGQAPTAGIVSTTAAAPEQPSPPTPAAPRRNTLHTVPAKKTRSSMSNVQRGAMQSDRLRRAAKANEIKHQASMAARKRTGETVERAVRRGQRLAAGQAGTEGATPQTALYPGEGRGSPRKASTKLFMHGDGRGAAGVRRAG